MSNHLQQDNTINERAQNLLRVVVERYIRDGQPVGSKTLAEEAALGVSSATIRNILAELEEHGYLRSPHTSAGRVPTAQGYRLFVNALITTHQLQTPDTTQVEQQLSPHLNQAELINSASNLLSELTSLAGLVMIPKRDCLVLRHLEFLPLNDNRVLVILVVNGHEVQNRIISTDRKYDVNELRAAGNYLNYTYAGQDVMSIHTNLLDGLQEDRNHLDQLMQAAIEVAGKAFAPDKTVNDYVLAGQSHLLEAARVSDLVHVQQLFAAFTNKQDILHLLDKSLNAEGVQIFIGEESGYDLLENYSFVTAPYSVDDQVVGALGVVGPTRMPYERVIPVVDITAKLLGVALNPGR